MIREPKGYKSRKLHLAYCTMGLLFVGGFMVLKWAAFAGVYSTLASSLVAVFSIYSGINVANGWVAGKNASSSSQSSTTVTKTEKVNSPDKTDDKDDDNMEGC